MKNRPVPCLPLLLASLLLVGGVACIGSDADSRTSPARSDPSPAPAPEPEIAEARRAARGPVGLPLAGRSRHGTSGSPATGGSPAGNASLSRGRVVYELHHTDGNVDLLRLDAGAASPVGLTRGPGRDLRPRWSPDGKRVAFSREEDGQERGTAGDIWLIDADGSGLRRITDHPAHDFDPAWLPDGQRIVFASRRDGDDNLWLLDLEDGSLRQLTDFDGGRAGAPSPSHDGRTVMFSADRLFSWQIWRLDLETGETQRLTGPLPGACNSAWSPATGRFVHMSGGDFIGTDLVSRRPDGSDKTDVGSGRGNNEDPQFSQDGHRLVWVSDRDGNWEVYEGAADGSAERRVTRTPQDERHPDLYLGESVRR